MASTLSFVEYACGQMGEAGEVSFRKMFGEYAVYLDGKVIALICDNILFVKPTAGGKSFAGPLPEAPPYSGARPHLVIGERLEDRQWVAELVRITSKELPSPKPKSPKPARKS